MLKNRINQKNSEKSRKIPENVANFFEKSLVRCLDFPKISTTLRIVAYKLLLIKKLSVYKAVYSTTEPQAVQQQQY